MPRQSPAPKAVASKPAVTPIPWSVSEGANGDVLITAPHERGIDTDIAHVYDGEEGGKPVAEANAALIVKAVNSHAALVQALRRLVRAYDAKQMTPVEDYAPLWAGVKELLAGQED